MKPSRVAPKKSALRYHGGKWKIAPWILSFFPQHTCYVEPYGGGASLLLRKTPAFVEVYNDLNDDIVNFFRTLRDRTDELLEAIHRTPFAKVEFEEVQLNAPGTDNLERARRLYVWACQGWGRPGIAENPGGWRHQKTDNRGSTAAHDWNDSSHLWAVAYRLRQVQIEHDDAIAVIQRYDTPSTLFYCDPPYPKASRLDPVHQTYPQDMTDEDHERLALALQSIQGMAIISSYRNELYDSLYPGWPLAQKQVWTQNRANTRMETLYISPRIKDKIPWPLQPQPQLSAPA